MTRTSHTLGPDRRLLAGASLFGAGWGLAGFCPRPAVVALAMGGSVGRAALYFVPAMLVGMLLHDRVWRRGRA